MCFKPWLVWLSWLEYHPVNQKVTSSIPSQGTCLHCGFSPWSGGYKRQARSMFPTSTFLYLSLFLPALVSEINEHFLS